MTAASTRRLLGYLALALFALIFLFPFVLSAATSFKTRPDVATNPVCGRCVCSMTVGWRNLPWQ